VQRQGDQGDEVADAFFSKWFYYFGGLADKVHGEVVPVEMDGMFNYTVREPLGVIAIIAPGTLLC